MAHGRDEAQDAWRAAVERAVDEVVRAGIVFSAELDAAAAERVAAAVAAAGDEGDRRRLEYALHTYLFDTVGQLPADPVPRIDGGAATGAGAEALCRALAAVDIAAVLSDREQTDAALAFTLLEEAMDMASVEMCSELFAHVERRAEVLRRNMTTTGGKGTVMLRMCNSLLRRIPQATLGEFAGRVQLFVANSLPISERSGVNLRGDVDQANLPQLDDAAAGEDAATYRAFWSLQTYFAQPQELAAPGRGFGAFADAAALAMDRFQEAGAAKQPALAGAGGSGGMVPKFLTSPALLRAQFGDAQFKCQVLLQLLIFARYVASVTGSRARALRETATNKFVVSELALTDADLARLGELRRRAESLLVATAADRGVFGRTARFVVRNEAQWARWKAESCRPFEQPPDAALVGEMQAAARAFLAVQGAAFPEPAGQPMGSQRLQALWAIETGAASVRGLGGEVRGINLLAAMGRLDLYCRADGDYELLTAREQERADLMQWRALRSAVQDNMFRKIDPASRSLASLRGEVFAHAASGDPTDGESTPMEVEREKVVAMEVEAAGL
ncbi:UDP-glucose-4-epimerase [Coemansia javaensis]|uniref:UDP-glucose-4-epimerase n=1 Tax=Coemansia javaensis TaxID=2761396 RepID=A0A9W8LFS6_9FUNG|nr:UDP-glucose-4-epimerase [Coemansia javaensis]